MDVFENIKAGKYKNTTPYPELLRKTDSISQNEKNKELVRQQRKDWRYFSYALENQFKKDMEEEFGLSHQHHVKIMEIAWDEGHADGLESVYF